jgi:hypothetical protein
MCVTIEKMDFSWLHTRVNFEFSFELFWRVLIAVWCVNNICLGKWKEFILFSVNKIEQLGQYGRYIKNRCFSCFQKSCPRWVQGASGSPSWKWFSMSIWNQIQRRWCMHVFSFCYGCSTVVSWFTFSLYCVKCVVFVWSNLPSDQFVGFVHCVMFLKFFVKT